MSILSAPLPTRSGAPCRYGCGAEVSPGPARHTLHERDEKGRRVAVPPSGACVACWSRNHRVAIPRGRVAIRSGYAGRLDPHEVPAAGRGPNRRAKRRLAADKARLDRARQNTTAARAFARMADQDRHRAIVERQHVEGKVT